MSAWDTGPFDNDTAADFAITLDEAMPEEREVLIRGVLIRTVNAAGDLNEAEQAVGAAALIAAQCPDGEPVATTSGPQKSLPVFPGDLRGLAAEALTRVLDDEYGPAGYWTGPAARRWRATIGRLHAVLDPPPPSMDVPLFDIDA